MGEAVWQAQVDGPEIDLSPPAGASPSAPSPDATDQLFHPLPEDPHLPDERFSTSLLSRWMFRPTPAWDTATAGAGGDAGRAAKDAAK